MISLRSVALVWPLLFWLTSHSLADSPRPIRALLVTGGCCHDYDVQKNLIAEGLQARAHMEVTVVQQGGSTTDTKIPLYSDSDWADKYDIILHDECFAGVKDPAWTQRILRPHQDGKPAVVIHCAMHCYRDGTDQWFRFCGVTSHGHGPHYGHEVFNLRGDHPIMQGTGPAWMNPQGELYEIAKLWPTAVPLASAKNRVKGNEEVCVWTNQYGKARVFGTTLGHHNQTVQHPEFLHLLTRGTLWACGKLSPEYMKPQPAVLVRNNVASAGKATASSKQAGHPAKHALDGNPATRWCADGPSGPQTWQVDLGQPQPLTGYRIHWESPAANYTYQVQHSVDGKNWHDWSATATTRGGGAELDQAVDSAQHVRVTFNNASGGQWASIWEVELFGTEHERLDAGQQRQREEQAALADVDVPEGFTATLFAAPPAVKYPVSVAAAPDGTLYVAVDQNGSLDREAKRGAIYRLRDLDGDGRADEVKLFVDDVDSPRGLVWDHDRLYVMHPPHLSAYIDEDADGVADRREVLVRDIAFGFEDRPADHTSNGVTLGIDGWLYLAIGDFGFMQATGADGRQLQFRGGGVVRVRPDGTGLQVYSRGTRNILEVAMDGLLNGFTRDNTNDGGGWDIRLHHFSGLEDHGYPRLYMNFGDEIVQPLADYGGGSGCGALYLDEPGFPAGYGNALYTADWGREQVFRHQLYPEGATYRPTQHDFLGLPRVTDLDVDAHSRLYVASWKGASFRYVGDEVGFLVQLRPEGYQAPSLPDFRQLTDAELVAQLRGPSYRRRLEAQRALVRRGLSSDTADRLQQLAADQSAPLTSRVAALFALKQAQGPDAHPRLASLAGDATIQAFAIRALADRWDQLQDVPADTLLAGLTADDARTRLESVVALARLGDVQHAAAMTELLTDKDAVVQHTAVQALIQLQAAATCRAVWDASDDAAQRQIALRVLQSVHTADNVTQLLKRAATEQNPQRRGELFVALCRLHFVEGTWQGNSWGTRPDTRGPYYQPETWSESARIQQHLQSAFANGTPEQLPFYLQQLARHRLELPGQLQRTITLADKHPELDGLVLSQLKDRRELDDVAETFLLSLAKRDDLSADQRRDAMLPLLRTGQLAALATALDWVAAADGPAGRRMARELFRSRAVTRHLPALSKLAAEAGTRGDWALAALTALAGDKRLSDQQQQDTRTLLDSQWQSPQGSLRMLDALRRSGNRKFETQVRQALVHGDTQVARAARRLAKQWKLPTGPTPAGPPIKSLKPADVLAAAVKLSGDVETGRAVFERLQCNKCHTVRPDEPLRGPYLPNVAKTYKRAQLAEAVLQPSKTLAQGFVTNVFVMDDGRVITGFVTSEGDTELKIRDAEGREQTVHVEAIEDRSTQTISVMPEGLLDNASVADFASLLSYLESLGKLAQ